MEIKLEEYKEKVLKYVNERLRKYVLTNTWQNSNS